MYFLQVQDLIPDLRYPSFLSLFLLPCRHRVLQQNEGLEFGLGSMQWELVVMLSFAWVMVYLIIWKGLHSSGKVREIIDITSTSGLWVRNDT